VHAALYGSAALFAVAAPKRAVAVPLLIDVCIAAAVATARAIQGA